MPYDLRVFQFPRDDIPYRTLADVFILLRSFKQSEIAVSNELDCVRVHIAHMPIWGDHEHIVMGNDGKSNQSLPAPFLNCQLCSCSSLLCIFCMCSFGLVRQKPLQHSNELMTNNYEVSVKHTASHPSNSVEQEQKEDNQAGASWLLCYKPPKYYY